MPAPLPKGSNFYIARRSLPADYEMPSLEVAADYYSMGYLISGDRTTITPNMTYVQHTGCLGTLAPYIYHRTFPASDAAYESILIKFTPAFVKPFTDIFGLQTLQKIYSNPINYFEPDIQDQVYTLLMDMVKEYNAKSAYKEFKVQCMLFQLFTIVLEKRLPDTGTTTHETPLTPPIIEAVYYIEKHYAEDLNIDIVAKISGFSSAYFSRLFKAQVGKAYSDYLCDVRLKHVQNLLLNTNKTITEIALETGYAYPGNLTEQFKRKVGMSPIKYRNKL